MLMSDDIKEQQHAVVKKPTKYLKKRSGRGFSLKEIKSASIPLDDAKNLSIPIDLRRKSVHDENVKILSALYREAISERTEAAVQLDVTKKESYKVLKQLRGIKGGEAKLLIEAGVRSLKTLIEEKPNALADDTNIPVEKIESWISQAKILIKRKGLMDSIDQLLQVKGVNKVYAKKLVDFGISTVEDLSQENAGVLSADLKVTENIISIWIEDAMRLTGKPVPKKKKPKAEKEKPDKKPKAEKKKKPAEEPKVETTITSLKDLEGIGKGDLKALKDLGITKLEQIIEEDAEEIATITGINQASLSRWIGDARELLGLTRVQEKPKEAAAPVESEPTPTADPMAEFLKLEGVGKKIAEKLVNAGIQTCTELIDCDPKQLSKDSKISEKTVKKIIESAKKLSQ